MSRLPLLLLDPSCPQIRQHVHHHGQGRRGRALFLMHEPLLPAPLLDSSQEFRPLSSSEEGHIAALEANVSWFWLSGPIQPDSDEFFTAKWPSYRLMVKIFNRPSMVLTIHGYGIAETSKASITSSWSIHILEAMWSLSVAVPERDHFSLGHSLGWKWLGVI